MISVVYEHKRYHQALSDIVRPGDTVIEIGCHVGGATKAIAKKAGKDGLVIAIDKAKQAEDAFKEPPANVRFVRGDVRLFETVDEVLKRVKKCDVLALDMGGGRFPDTAFKVWCIWSGVFKPRDSVIRNSGLGEFLHRARLNDPSIEELYPLSKDAGWLAHTSRTDLPKLKEGLEEMKLWMGKKKSDKSDKSD